MKTIFNLMTPVLVAACLLMTGQSATAALVAHYTFDDPGNVLANSGSATINWNNASGVTHLTDGKFGGAGGFVAGTSSAWTSQFGAADVDLSSFSLSLHVRSTQTHGGWVDFISIGTGNNVVFVLERMGNTGGVAIYNIGDVGGDSGGVVEYTDFNVNDGQWHHLGLVSDGSSITLYVNGVNRGSSAYTGSGTITALQLASRFGDPTRALTTDLDDVAVYDGVLNDAQMAWLANNPAIPVPIPEPASLALLGIGGLLMLRRRHTRLS